jgi:hypothetical protein
MGNSSIVNNLAFSARPAMGARGCLDGLFDMPNPALFAFCKWVKLNRHSARTKSPVREIKFWNEIMKYELMPTGVWVAVQNRI